MTVLESGCLIEVTSLHAPYKVIFKNPELFLICNFIWAFFGAVFKILEEQEQFRT